MNSIQICDMPQGRLGNAIFRYLASTIFLLNYGGNRVYDINYDDPKKIIVDDIFYLKWKNNLLYNNIKPVQINKYLFLGYFQHDDILTKYKNELIKHIQNNPNDLLITDGNNNNITNYKYPVTSYKVEQILTTDKPFNKYDIVFHLRLEDFITYGFVMNPNSLIKLLDNHKNEKICFVVNKIQTKLEEKYIEFFTKKYNIVVESNDIIQDYHIMKNAKILGCSCSTISWIASFFSETVELVYFPNYNNNRLHETFKKPIDNTVLYEFSNCSIEELNKILDE
jgi:hypothetical protein